MKKKTKQKIGLILLIIMIIAITLLRVIGPDKIWDSMLGEAVAITLIAVCIIAFLSQIIEAVVYLSKNK